MLNGRKIITMLNLLIQKERSHKGGCLSPSHGSCYPKGTKKPASHKTLEDSFLSEVGKLQAFKKNEVIFWDGEVSRAVYFIVSGVVRGAKLLCDGRRQVTRFAFAGEFLEYAHLPQVSYTAEAVTGVEARIISIQSFNETISSDHILRQFVMNSVLNELYETQNRITALARLTAQERVAQFLYNIYLRSSIDNEGTFHLPMQRQDIADYLGLTIETVSRVFSKLKRENRINLLSSNRVVIPDLLAFKDELLANVT